MALLKLNIKRASPESARFCDPADGSLADGKATADDKRSNFKPLLTLTRTLQELLAPKAVQFYNSTWTPMGTKAQLVSHLSVITKIPVRVLEDRDRLPQTSIAQRMSWAAGRSTSRIEDQAYALLGIFGISMPLVYGGEGARAFMRLQEMIIQTSPREDHSLLVWPSEGGGLLAPSPDAFMHGDQIVSRAHCLDETFELSNKGLRVTLLARSDVNLEGDVSGYSFRGGERYAETITVALNCQYEHHAHGQLIALRLRRRPRVHTLGLQEQQYNVLGEVTYDRLPEMTTVTSEELRHFTATTLTIARKSYSWPAIDRRISISDDSAAAHALQYVSHGQGRNGSQRVGCFFNLPILNASIAFSRLVIRCPQGHFKDAVLAIGMVYSQTPPKLFVHAFEDGQNEGMERLDTFKLCRVIREGEERLFEVSGAQSLRIAARYVLIGGELMWNLEIGRPKSSSDFARNLLEKRRGFEHYPELGVGTGVPGSLVPGIPYDSPHAIQPASQPASPAIAQLQPRITHTRLPMLNTNISPQFNSPGLEMVSPVPATSIDAKQYWQQQQFLAELYLAHIQKQEQAAQPDFVVNARRSKSVLRPPSTLRQTRLVRFMQDRMQRLFRLQSAGQQIEESSTTVHTAEQLTADSENSIFELHTPHAVPELPANSKSHELSDTCQRSELPAIPVVHALDSNEIYELDSTPRRQSNQGPVGYAEIPGISLTTIDGSNTLRRRFSWEMPIEQPPSYSSEPPAQAELTRVTVETSCHDSRGPESLPVVAEAAEQTRPAPDSSMLADQLILSNLLGPHSIAMSELIPVTI